jgi:serine/threonine-protein kinase
MPAAAEDGPGPRAAPAQPHAPVAAGDWPRLLELVAQALDIPAPAREAWLRALRLPPAQEDALRELLDDRRAIESQDFMATLPALGAARPPADPAGRVGPGTRIGAWALVRRIGEGGMSTVWLAQRADGQVERQVALKLPHAGPGHELLARRLLRERSILAGLEHRHIARLYDVGVTEAGVPYLVMEHVEGDALTVHADRQRLSVAQRLALFRQVLDAVQYAHGKLVLHRDLKPQNILVTAAGEVKLLDFGIAKVLSAPEALPGATELTQATGRRLTPAYASPEQLRGEPLGTASDVWSLGVVLYEMLCGRRPFDHAGLSPAQCEQAVLGREPTPLGRQELAPAVAAARGASPQALRRSIAGDLNAVVLKALARAPARRYAAVEAFDADIARWLAGRPVAAHPPGRGYYVARFVQRHRWSVALGTAAALALATAGGIALTQARHAQQQAARAAAVRDFLLAMFEETDPDRPGGHDITARTLLENGRRRAAQSLAATPDLMAELLRDIGNSQANLSDRLAADATLAQAMEGYRAAGDERARLLVLLDRVDNALALGRMDEAEALLKSAASLAAPFGHDLAVTGTLLREQAFVAGFRHDWLAEKAFLERYLALAEGRAEVSPQERIEALENLATANARSDDLAGALVRIAQASAIVRAHPELPAAAPFEVVDYRQDIEFQWGRYGAIERAGPGEIATCEARLHPLSPMCVKLRSRLQAARLRLGLFEQARALNAGLAPLLDPASPRDRVWGLSGITQALARTGQLRTHPETYDSLRQVVDSAEAAALDPNYRLRAFTTLAEAEVLAQRPLDALAWIARAHGLIAASHGLAGGEIARTHVIEAAARQQQGRPDLALSALGPLCAPAPEPRGVSRVQDLLFGLNCVEPLVASRQGDAALALLQRNLPDLRANLDATAPAVLRAQAWLDSLRATRALPAPGSADIALWT